MQRLVIFAGRSDAAAEFLLYDRNARTLQLLFKGRSDLDDVPLRPMQPVTIQARDGLALPSYLTLPRHDFHNGPFVLAIHGGPYSRDTWGYNGLHQWLANRGYGVLSVNFRGSTGFGKSFIRAADQEWAGRMQVICSMRPRGLWRRVMQTRRVSGSLARAMAVMPHWLRRRRRRRHSPASSISSGHRTW